MATGGGDHRTKAAVLFITPTRISVGGELGGPSSVLPIDFYGLNECKFQTIKENLK